MANDSAIANARKVKNQNHKKVIRSPGNAGILPAAFLHCAVQAECLRSKGALLRLAFSEKDFSRTAALQRKTIVTLIAHRITINPCSRQRFAVDLLGVDYKLTLRANQVRPFFRS